MTIEPDLSRAIWCKSSFSNGQGGDCVEVARKLPGIVGVRDSKDAGGAKLVFSSPAWAAFTHAVKDGQHSL
jgi:hypothetical protein